MAGVAGDQCGGFSAQAVVAQGDGNPSVGQGAGNFLF